jgi:hypothetical protein
MDAGYHGNRVARKNLCPSAATPTWLYIAAASPFDLVLFLGFAMTSIVVDVEVLARCR